MKTFFKWLAVVTAVLLVAVVAAAYWFLSPDDIAEPDIPGQLVSGELEHDGLQRSWQAYVPANRPENPALVILYHGSMGDGAGMRRATFYGFDIQAERHGFVVAYPDGFESHWNGCRKSASYSANTRRIDDIGFTRALVARLSTDLGVDPRRVYVGGFSNGGHMVYRLALEAPELIAAGLVLAANMPVADNNECTASESPVPMMLINGTADPVNPFHGGVVEIAGDSSRGAVLPALDSAAYWAQLAGYDLASAVSSLADTVADDGTVVETRRWSAPGKAPVELVSVVGGGHNIPHPVFRLARILGPTSHEFDTSEVAWRFFSSVD